jgi:hypothetical protein
MGPTNIGAGRSASWKRVELSSSISTTLGEACFSESEHPSDFKRVVCRDCTAVTCLAPGDRVIKPSSEKI